MSPQRSDPGETGHGPLFEGLGRQVKPLSPREPRQLTHSTDPATSTQVAVSVYERLGSRQRFALQAVRDYPGHTTKEMARHLFNAEHGGLLRAADAEVIRQQIGRRLNELNDVGLIYRKGTRDGCALWWPSRSEEVQR